MTGLHGTEDPETVLASLGPLTSLCLWLGPINLFVGLFNLVPAFPLDGGRVLRALLWIVTKNYKRATSWATALGQAFAWLLMVTGVALAFGLRLPLFGTGLGSGLWLVLIGWFLNGAASRSHERLVLEEALAGLTVARIMRRNVPQVAPDLLVAELVSDWFMSTEARAFPVVAEGGPLLGIVSLSDVRNAPRDQWNTLRTRDVMTPAERVLTISPSGAAFEALEAMAKSDVNQVPVVENGQLVGMIERRDIARWLEMSRVRMHDLRSRPLS
jgi:CBS domain-containing protein